MADSIERFLVEEDLNWIIDNNYTDWKLCARALLNYYRKETVPLNYVVIEVIFSQLFGLPNPPHLVRGMKMRINIHNKYFRNFSMAPF